MNTFSLQDLCDIVSGTLLNQNNECEFKIDRVIEQKNEKSISRLIGISTDTRNLQTGDIFFAINGENFNAHNFVDQAALKGAAACIVSQTPKNFESIFCPLIKVLDTRLALAQLAAFHRQKVAKKTAVAAIAGSCGKTTVKEMLAQIVLTAGPTTYSYGNFNNDIGCPLSVLRLHSDDRYGIFEIGSSAPGEVERLAQIVDPQVALITNIYLEHPETFGDLQSIAQGESEILLNLKQGSTIILPQEDAMLDYLKSRVPATCKIITFGFSSNADVQAELIEFNPLPQFTLNFKKQNFSIRCSIPILGRHNVLNACAAAAAALSLNVSPQNIQNGLKNFKGEKMRFEIMQNVQGTIIVNDCYNSNPGSLRASLESFAESFKHNTNYAVIGDMLELGIFSKQEHQTAADILASLNFKKVFLYGKECQVTFETFQQKFPSQDVFYSTEKQDIVQEIKKLTLKDCAILFKASRGIQLEEIIEKII